MIQMPLRIPNELHESLKLASAHEGISLNQYCLYLLTKNTKTKQDVWRDRGENLLTFIAEAQTFQKEINKNHDKKN